MFSFIIFQHKVVIEERNGYLLCFEHIINIVQYLRNTNVVEAMFSV